MIALHTISRRVFVSISVPISATRRSCCALSRTTTSLGQRLRFPLPRQGPRPLPWQRFPEQSFSMKDSSKDEE